MKMDDLIKKLNDAEAEKVRLRAEIDELREKVTLETERAEAAGKIGSEAAFLKAKQAAQTAENMIQFRETRLETLAQPAITIDEAKEAWADYIGPIDKEIKKKYEAYLAARHELYLKYADIMDTQRDCYKKREKLASLAGAGDDILRIQDDARNYFKMHQIGINDLVYDSDFFKQVGEQDAVTMTDRKHMLRTGRPLH